MSQAPEKPLMGLDQIQAAYAKGVEESNEAMKQKSQEAIFQQFKSNSKNRHQDSSKATFATRPSTVSTTKIQTASSTTPEPTGR